MASDSYNSLQEKLKSTIEKGHDLLLKLQPFSELKGINRLKKKINQEITFLKQFDNNEQSLNKRLKEEHVKCTNLYNLEAIVKSLQGTDNPVAVLQIFRLGETKEEYESKHMKPKNRKLCVDIVSGGGSIWNKVIARNPKALSINATGGQQYGQKSIIQQVEDFVYCANQNQYLFCSPTVNIIFHYGVSFTVAQLVKKVGATFVGDIVHLDIETEVFEDCVNDMNDENITSSQTSKSNQENDSTLNLDITAMIAYISALTNGCSNYVFQDQILTDQAKRERSQPVKKELESIFNGKKLVCCESAVIDFKSIVDTLGGDGEKLRAKDLLENKIHAILPDIKSERVENLKLSDKVKSRSKSIFGTGDAMEILTVTANKGFVRAARSQGLSLAVILHESSALTESKMHTATQICDVI